MRIIGQPLEARRVLRAFEAVDDEGERNNLARELSNLRAPGLRPQLERILRSHPDEDTRAMAAWTLGMRFDERAAEKLAEAYRDPVETVHVRAYAAEALGHLLAYSKQVPRVTPTLLEGLEDPAPEIRFWSCFALANFDDESALPALRGLVGDTAVAPGWGEVGDEAEWAIAHIEGDTEFEARWMKAIADRRR